MTTRALLLFSIILFFHSIIFSQNLSDKEYRRLEKLHVNIENIDLNDTTTRQNINQLLRFEKKRKAKKMVGIIFTSAAVVSLATGVYLINKGKSTIESGHDVASPIGYIFASGAVVYAGVSIPFWIASNKNKKKRDKLKILFYQITPQLHN